MKGQYAKKARAHAEFYDEEIVYPILKNKKWNTFLISQQIDLESRNKVE